MQVMPRNVPGSIEIALARVWQSARRYQAASGYKEAAFALYSAFVYRILQIDLPSEPDR